MIAQWLTCIDDSDIIGTVFLDFRKAFDLVDHTLLLDKLAIYKCNDAALDLLASYVSNRQQVDSGERSSKSSIIKSGMHHYSHITKQLLTSISVDIRIYLPSYPSGLGELSLFSGR